MKLKFSLFALALSALFASCSARIEGQVETGGAAALSLEVSIEPRISALLRSLSSFSGAAAAGPVLDAAAVSRSLKTAPGVAAAALRNKGASGLTGTLEVSRIEDFLSAAGAQGPKFITFEETGNTSGRIRVYLDRAAGPRIIGLLSKDIADYLSALMAPAATGEVLERQEYLDLVKSVYGEGAAAEIAAARIRASVRFPGPVKSVTGGKASGRKAEFDVPLLDLLVLDKPCLYEAVW